MAWQVYGSILKLWKKPCHHNCVPELPRLLVGRSFQSHADLSQKEKQGLFAGTSQLSTQRENQSLLAGNNSYSEAGQNEKQSLLAGKNSYAEFEKQSLLTGKDSCGEFCQKDKQSLLVGKNSYGELVQKEKQSLFAAGKGFYGDADPRSYHLIPARKLSVNHGTTAIVSREEASDDEGEGTKLASESISSAPSTLLEQDGKSIYAGMTLTELLFTLINLQLVAYEPLVDLSIKVLKSSLMKYPVWSQPILGVVKRTAYAHFCAGEDASEASHTLKRMWELGLKSILDYSLEDAMDNASCDHNLQGFLHTVKQTRQLPPGSVSFSCMKVTAICPLPLLEHVSALLRWQHKHPEYKLPWKEDVLPLLAHESATYHVQCPPEPLSDVGERDLLRAKERLWKLCDASDEAGLPLLVDAEYTSVQPAIDYLTYLAALRFNQNGQTLVYGTVQAYLKDALPRLVVAANEASKRGVGFAVKLVRGAYMTRESELAATLGAQSPIHSSIQQTHKCYDTCAAFMMEQAASGQGAVVLATHNFDSGRVAVAKADELGLANGNPRLQFAQLKGMADRLSLALVHAGFQVSKYLPFGPVAHVMPYLIRRAEENRGLLGNTTVDQVFIWEELKRRLTDL